MPIVIPAIRGKMGSNEFYTARMSTRDLILGTQPAQRYSWWDSISLEDRMQREVKESRILEEIAPYFGEDPDRFTGAIIITVYNGEVHFESLTEFNAKIPIAYRSQSGDMGFLTIDGGELVVLDGQHRWEGFEANIRGKYNGKFSQDLGNDHITVIFIKHEASEKTRRIFNKVNRYAKQTSRSDNLITSEDDGNAIVTRWLLTKDGAPFNSLNDKKENTLVNWKSNSLPARDTRLTTMSALYEITKLILDSESPALAKEMEVQHNRPRPNDEDLENAFEIVSNFWVIIFEELEPYRIAIKKVEGIPAMRMPDSKYSLLFKPAAQIAFIEGLLYAKNFGIDLKVLLQRALGVNWSMNNKMWKDVIVTASGSINTKTESRDAAKDLIAYLLSGDKMDKNTIEEIRQGYNQIKGLIELHEQTPLPKLAYQMAV